MPVEWFTCSHVFKGAGTWLFSLELFFISFSKIIFSIFLWQRYSEMLFGWMEYLPWSVMRARSQLWQIWCIHFALHRFSLLVLFLWFLCDDKHFFVWRKHCAPVKSHCRTITVSHSVILSPYPLPMCLEVSTYVIPVPPSWQTVLPSSWVQFQSCGLPIWNVENIFKDYWSHPYPKGVCEMQVFDTLVQLQNSDYLQYFLMCICCCCCSMYVCIYTLYNVQCTLHRGCVNTPPYQV